MRPELSCIGLQCKSSLLTITPPEASLKVTNMMDCNTVIVIYKALYFDVAQGRMNGAPNETRTHLCRFASLAC